MTGWAFVNGNIHGNQGTCCLYVDGESYDLSVYSPHSGVEAEENLKFVEELMV